MGELDKSKIAGAKPPEAAISQAQLTPEAHQEVTPGVPSFSPEQLLATQKMIENNIALQNISQELLRLKLPLETHNRLLAVIEQLVAQANEPHRHTLGFDEMVMETPDDVRLRLQTPDIGDSLKTEKLTKVEPGQPVK